jgi:hypothetical protein
VSAALIGPQPVGTDMLAGLTLDEMGVLRAHLTSGWYKQGVVYSPAVKCDLWQETKELLSDMHRAHEVIFGGAR